METIKISVEVSVNLSENTQSFIRSLFAAGLPSGAQVAAAVAEKSASQPTPAMAPKPQTPTAKPAQTEPAVTPAPGAPAAQTVSSASKKSIEDVRTMLAKKVNEHRDAIKYKLTELGSPSVTKLDPAKYDEMFNFLESL